MSQAARKSIRPRPYAIDLPSGTAVFVALNYPTWAQVQKTWKGCGYEAQTTQLSIAESATDDDGRQNVELFLDVKTRAAGGSRRTFSFIDLRDEERQRLIYELMTPAERDHCGVNFKPD